MKELVLALTALGLVGGVTGPSTAAAPCHDKSGKFVKCPTKPQMCRDSKGHFIKCPAKPKTCRDAKGHFVKCK